jgi:ankyrin repeat protein/serine/threonine protein kinase
MVAGPPPAPASEGGMAAPTERDPSIHGEDGGTGGGTENPEPAPVRLLADDFLPSPWQERQGWNRLHVAMAGRAPEGRVRLLWESDPEMVTQQNMEGNSPLHEGLAAGADGPAVFALLMRDGQRLSRIANGDGELPLHIACERGTSYLVTRALVSANPLAVEARTHKTEETPLHYLMRSGAPALSTARLLLEACPSVAREFDRYGRTPHMVGVASGAPQDVLDAVYHATFAGAAPFPGAAPNHPDDLDVVYPPAWSDGSRAPSDDFSAAPSSVESLPAGIPRSGSLGGDDLKQYEPQGLRLQHRFNTLHVALSKQAPVDTIRLLLELSPEMATQKNTDGNTPLMEGLQAGAGEDSLNALVEACRECCAVVNDNNECALHYAVQRASPQMVENILNAFPTAASMQTFNDEDVPLHRLVGGPLNQDAGLVRTLLAGHKGAAMVRDRYGRTPLHVAIASKADVGAILAVFRAFPEALGIQDAKRRTPLDEAHDIPPRVVQDLQKECARACDRRGFNVNDVLAAYKPGSVHVNQGWNALHIAMAKGAGSAEVVAIVQSSPNLARKQNDAGNFPLFEGFGKAGLEALMSCLDAYPDACKVPNNSGDYALHLAATIGYPIIIEAIIHVYPSAINLQASSSEATPLHIVVGSQPHTSIQIHAIQLLASQGALEARDSAGNTPLHVAIKNNLGPTEFNCLFFQYPGAARIPDNEDRLPLHSAIEQQYSEEQLLLLLEVFPDAARMTCGEDGMLPLHLAMKHRSGSRFTSELIGFYNVAPTVPTRAGSTALALGLTYGAPFESVFELLNRYPGAARTRDSESTMPLHIAMMKGVPTELVNLLLEAYPDAVEVHNVQGHTPFHAGIVPAVHLLKERHPDSFQPHEVRGGQLQQRIFSPQCKVGNGSPPLEDLLKILQNLNAFLEAFPSVAEQRDRSGYLPLLHFCMIFNPSVVTLEGEAQREATAAISDTLVRIYKANPAAAEVVGPFVGNPINVLVGECSVATDIRKNLESENCKRLKILLGSARDGRALQSLCTLENAVSLWAFFSLFDESGLLDSKSLDGNLVLNLNREVIVGWSLLDILADFDTQDSASVLLQVVVDQKTKLDSKDQVFQISNDDGKTILEFASLQEVSDVVKTRVADRAKLSNSSPPLKRWGQEYGRFLRKYRLEKRPKHVSETCVVVFGTEAIKEDDGRMTENPVALKFMCRRDTFRREVEKRKNTDSKYVVPIKASYSSVAIDDFDCTKVNLQAELAPYPGIVLKDSVLKYVIVMDCGAGFDLHDFISHQNVAGKDLFAVTSIAKEIAHCLKFLNENCGTIHGDVKARNFVARGVGLVGFAAIDLDNAASIGRDKAGEKRTSSGYLPPEQAAVEAYFRSETEGAGHFEGSDENGTSASQPLDDIMKQISDASSRKDSPEVLRLVKLYQKPKPSMFMPMDKPEFVTATPQYDMWCFGALLYFLCTGKQLFNVDTKEDVDDEDLVKIRDWDDNSKEERLSKVGPGWPLKLLDSLLQKDPRNRPENWKQIIDELNRLTNRDDNVVYDRFVVFQSAPLVYTDANNQIQALPRLDFNQESEMLREALRDAESYGCTIEVIFETASLDRLNAFLAQEISNVLHFSGHGHPSYVAWEDERGGLNMVDAETLKRMVKSASHKMKLVFISACHSEWVAQAFIDAGVPHAVCCLVDEQLHHVAASEFTRNFYRALACRKTLAKAFEFAQEAVMNSPHVENPELEAAKFMLLPRTPEDPSYHDVNIFFAGIPPFQEDWGKDTVVVGLPRSRDLIVGREVHQYSILNNLLSTDIVRVCGEEQMGKAAIAAAVCQHMLQRPRTYTYDFYFWFPPTGSINVDDVLYQSLRAFLELTVEGGLSHPTDPAIGSETDKRLQTATSTIADTVTQKSVLMVIDIREYEKKILEQQQQRPGIRGAQETDQRLYQAVQELLEISTPKSFKIILISDRASTEWIHPNEERVPVDVLDFPSAVTLFAYNVPATLKRNYPILNSRMDFIEYICDPPDEIQGQDDYLDREADLFNRYFGGGVPSRCRQVAQRVTEDQVLEILHWWEPSEERESLIPLGELFID